MDGPPFGWVPPQVRDVPEVQLLAVSQVDGELETCARRQVGVGLPNRAQDPAWTIDVDGAIGAWDECGLEERWFLPGCGAWRRLGVVRCRRRICRQRERA